MVRIWVLLWIPLVFVAILNGTLRVEVYGRWVPELAAHQISTVTGILLVGLYTWLAMKRWPVDSTRTALLIGLLWFLMTIAFEFGFGHFVMGNSWERLFHDYNLLAGRVWSLFLLWVLVAPLAVFRLQKRGMP